MTSYQYTHDDMRLDQDFLPLPYFTLRQDTRQHAVTQEVVVRSRAAEGDGHAGGCAASSDSTPGARCRPPCSSLSGASRS